MSYMAGKVIMTTGAFSARPGTDAWTMSPMTNVPVHGPGTKSYPSGNRRSAFSSTSAIFVYAPSATRIGSIFGVINAAQTAIHALGHTRDTCRVGTSTMPRVVSCKYVIIMYDSIVTQGH